jgi:type IV pilus assembly protein PilW
MNNHPLPLGARGFSLVELMIALALGLFLTGVAINVVVLNRQAFRTTENLSRMQENARSAFELLARDIRTAGGNPCGTPMVVNVLNNPANNWWANWAAGSLIGYENGAAPQNYGLPAQNAPALALIQPNAGANAGLNPSANIVANTDAILLLSGDVQEGTNIRSHNPATFQFTLNTNAHGFVAGDVLMACDNPIYVAATPAPPVATIFQASGVAGNVITHAAGGAGPGNCAAGLGPLPAAPCSGNAKTFGSGGVLSRLSAAFWYVGNNGRGSSSLYRVSMNGTPTAIQNDEIIDNVCVPGQGVTLLPENRACQGLQITYITRNTTTAVVAATAVAGIDWSVSSQTPKPNNANEVVAVRISLDLQSRDTSGVNNANVAQRLATNLTETIFLRNRDAAQ